MNENRTCGECGADLPANAPEGLCPRCLAAMALRLGPDSRRSDGIATFPALTAPGAMAAVMDQAPRPAETRREPKTKLTLPIAQGPGIVIGRYKLLEKIGEGGFGLVYVAEQREPIKRRIALKIIKLGMDTRQVVARFEAERQALALMDHPNIARVLDAGATETGRPYFVMELVRGIQIIHYCDQNKLSTRERLGLFIRVCQAIQHAHQKGIIHRDIKPSNILVTLHDGAPVPKVIDFGIAKATQGEFTNQTVYTQFQHFVGTPAYMSPEQAEMSGLDIDTRSDIYSLGVLLYELLTGRTPFDQKKLLEAGLERMRWIIREQEPIRPSTLVSSLEGEERTTTARQRGADPPKLTHLLRGDLDWIVMKCLEKDRTRRYETASDLAKDVQRHMANEPVNARPPSSVYRFQKMVRRNKLVFAATSAIAASLLLGLGVSIALLARAREAHRQALASQQRAEAGWEKARTEASRSTQVARYLEGMLADIAPSLAKGCTKKLVQVVLERSDERVVKELNGQPDVEASVRTTLGGVHAEIGQFEMAETHLSRALMLKKKLGGEDNLAVAQLLDAFAKLYLRWGKPMETKKSYEEALAVRKRFWRTAADHGDLEALNQLAWLLATCADPKFRDGDDAVRLAEKAVAATNRGDARKLDTLAAAYAEVGQFAKAVSVQEEAIAITHDHDRKEELQSRLSLYRSDAPYREPDFLTPTGALTPREGFPSLKTGAGHFTKDQLARVIPPRDPQASTNLIDLSSFYNVPLTERWHDSGPSDLSEVPRGIQTFADVQFDVRGLIQVGARYQEGEDYPDQVRTIPVSRPCRRLHFLHAAIYADRTPYGARLGAYVIHYASGRQTEIPIVLGQSLADWFAQPKEQNQTFTIAWTGFNSESRRQGRTIRLFKSTWDNPLPAETVKTIDFVSFRAGSAPFLVAITAEP